MRLKRILGKATCDHCGRRFYFYNPRQRYCAPRCRIAAHRARKENAAQLQDQHEHNVAMRALISADRFVI